MPLKKFVKKITKPISKVLDKIVPNEIKPFLPYAAALAPVLGPMGAFGKGIADLSKFKAAGLYGLGSLTSQLAQEGSEGEFDIAPVLAASASGYLSAPGTTGITTAQALDPAMGSTAQAKALANRSFLTKAKDLGITGIQGIEKFMQAPQTAKGFLGTTKAITQAAAPAVTTQITQDAINTAKQALDDYNAELAEYERLTGEAQTASDDARRTAIRAAMIAGNHSEDVITETLALLGLKDGGRVGLREGGMSVFEQITQIPAASQNAPMFFGRPAFAPSLQQAQAVFPRLNELEQGVNIAENKLTNIRDRLGSERMGGLMAVQPSYGIQPAFQPLTGLLRIQDQLQLASGPARGMKDGGITGLKDGGMLDLDGKEMDLRGGGFVPIGKKERADDVPARLSKNEFVMTADAVRAAGGGDVNKGAKRMYETMNRLEARA